MTSSLVKYQACIVSGAAIGVDTIAYNAAGASNTIAVVANGLDIKYPSINKNLIYEIENNGLILSSYKQGELARNYTFVLRNEIVVALGDILMVTQADLNSGSMTSVEFAQKMNKEIYVLPHRINESLATNSLIQNNLAKPIYNIDEFIANIFGETYIGNQPIVDEVLKYCKNSPLYDEAILRYPDKILEYELNGKIQIKNGKIFII